MNVHREAFQLSYHHEGFDWEAVWWKLPVFLRRWYLEELKDQKEREKKQVENSADGGRSDPSSSDEFSGEGVPDEYKDQLSVTDREKPELHEMMENAPPDVRRKWKGE